VLTYNQLIEAVKSSTTKFAYPDKIEPNLSHEEFKEARNKIASIGQGIRGFNRHCLIKNSLPTSSDADYDKRTILKAMDTLFKPDRNLSLDGDNTIYHGMRHEPKFEENGLTTIKALVSAAPTAQRAITYAGKTLKGETQHPSDVHHVLEIKQRFGQNVPAVNIAHHSTRSSENEIVMPPFTVFKKVGERQEGIHPKTKKPVVIHTVYPVFTHPNYDMEFKDLSKEEKRERVAYLRNH